MIKSMTGFGKAVTSFGNKNITVEIRSLNSKQLDLNVRMPSLYREKEMGLRSMLSKTLGRGKSELNISLENIGEESNHTINHDLATNYFQELQKLSDKLGLQSPSLETLIKMPDVMRAERQPLNEEEWKAVAQTIDQAVENLIDFRNREGGILEEDFKKRNNTILELLDAVEQYEEERVKTVREKIEKHLEESVGEQKVDQNRLEQELIYYLEKLDITEEKLRLRTHCAYFEDTLNADTSQGKKLGFIVQEMGREINTTGSKANHAEIQKLVVQMKDELEKIKEQMLNVL